MFGTYRFILALAVALDHMGLFPAFHVGSTAVIGFFILSGYVMAHSFSKYFGSDLRQALRFYLDRALRIYPIYLVLLSLIVGFFLLTERARVDINVFSVLSHVTVYPLNFWRVLEPRHLYMLRDHTLVPIPPAPTLAIELQYYLLLPFLLVHRWLAYAGYAVTLAVFTLAASGRIHHSFAETYLTGLLFVFLAGSLLYDGAATKDGRRASQTIVVGTSAYLGALLLYLAGIGRADDSVTLEVIVGFELGIVCTYVLAQITRSSSLDYFLGNLSYPLFLTHSFAIWLFEFFAERYRLPVEPRARVVLQIVVALALSAAAWLLLDSHVQRFRKALQLWLKPRLAA
jgi:peptidoglycan/LPS O-acetylase OafA/YrhL